MTLNLVLLVLAVLIALCAIAVALATTPGRAVTPRTIGVATLVLGLGGGVALAIGAWTAQLDPFGAAHLAYLLITAAVPLVAVGLLVQLWRRDSAPRVSVLAVLAIGIAAAPIGLYATHVEPFWLRVDRTSVDLDRLQKGLRIGVLSDVQSPTIGAYEREAVERLLAEDPDLILIPGDLWQTEGGRLESLAVSGFRDVLALLDQAVEHVVVVEGNTDNTAGLRELAAGTNVIVLANEVVEIDINEQRVVIAGLGLNRASPERSAAIEAVEQAPDDALRLILAHQPDAVLDINDPEAIDLVVSGHTHGGQIAVPWFGPIVTLTGVPRSVAAGGLHGIGGTTVYVSTGVGRERNQAPQVRFLVRPSIGIVEVS